MPSGDIQFAALWPSGYRGWPRRAIVPLHCSLSEASRTVACLVLGLVRRRQHRRGSRAYETCALGSFCLFIATAPTPSTIIIVGTRRWDCTPTVFALFRRAQAELRSDPSQFGYWQLRDLAFRVEVTAPPPNDASCALPPRLFEEHTWDDEETESWEDDNLWSDVMDEDGLARGLTGPYLNDISTMDVDDAQRIIDATAALLLSNNPEAMRAVTTGYEEERLQAVLQTAVQGSAGNDTPFFETNFDNPQPVRPQPTLSLLMAGSAATLPGAQAAAAGDAGGVVSTSIGGGAPPFAVGGSGNLASDSVQTGTATAVAQPSGGMGLSMPSPPAVAERSDPAEPKVFYSEASGAAAAVTQAPAASEIAEASPVAEPNNVSSQEDASASRITAATAGAADPAPFVSAAVTEDLAYAYQARILQSYAITGSVLVAASEGAKPRLRVTDSKGHIATVTTNDTISEENAAGTAPPTREYLCKVGEVQQEGGAAPRFLPALRYRCSPSVRQLPVRITCRLRPADRISVSLRVQVTVNPYVSQPLSGVSVLISLPFTPRRDRLGRVKAEPPVTLKPDGKILEWVFPSEMKGGDKQIMQARLYLSDQRTSVLTVPLTAPAMVRCHMLDSMFSSVEVDAAALGGEGADCTPGRVMRRCRVQCTEQG